MRKAELMRVPWPAVSLVIGVVAMGLLPPMCSDSTGTTQAGVIVTSLLGGLLLGFILDDVNRPRRDV